MTEPAPSHMPSRAPGSAAAPSAAPVSAPGVVPGEEPDRRLDAALDTVPDAVPDEVPDTRAIVDHDALHANLRAIRERVGPDVAVLLPVKANAYGHGAVEVARRAEAAGVVDAFGVATVAEGVALREAGVRAPILKFSPAAARDLPAALAAGLTLPITSATDLADLAVLVGARGEAAAGDGPAEGPAGHGARPHAVRASTHPGDLVADGKGGAGEVPVHLKVDTGMGRVGVPVRSAADARAAADLATAIEATPGVRLDGVFTHLAVADIPAQDEFTAGQVAAFTAAVEAITARIGRRPRWVHAANSGAVLAHPDAWFDLVRPGIMSYGYPPDAATPATVAVRPALEWRARISHVKDVAAGECVGYGRTWTAPRDTRVATLPIGYADGYDRHLSNRGVVVVGGRACPVVGRVCMDQTTIDVGPGADVRVGDEAVLLGGTAPAPSADDLAGELGTISYEVLCAIGARVERVHVGPPAPR